MLTPPCRRVPVLINSKKSRYAQRWPSKKHRYTGNQSVAETPRSGVPGRVATLQAVCCESPRNTRRSRRKFLRRHQHWIYFSSSSIRHFSFRFQRKNNRVSILCPDDVERFLIFGVRSCEIEIQRFIFRRITDRSSVRISNCFVK